MAARCKAWSATRTNDLFRAPLSCWRRTVGRADLFKSTTSDQNGHYEFAVIAPGNYKLFAWEDVEPEAWEDSDFLKDYEKLGEKVVLEPGARASVDLHLAIRPEAQ